MKQQHKKNGSLSRRSFIGSAALVAAAASAYPVACSSGSAEKGTSSRNLRDSPGSEFSGIRIGVITYSWRDQPGGAEEILRYCKEAGIGTVELMGDVIESYAGIPPSPTELPDPLPEEAQARLDAMIQGFNISLEQLKSSLEPPVWQMVVSSIVGTTEEQREWRASVPMTRFEALRKMYNDAGVNIHIAKISPSAGTDEEIDYAFRVAAALGARGITDEVGDEAARRLGPFAEKHGMHAIFHNHNQFADENFDVDRILAASPANMLNFDCGHYFGSTGLNPADFIRNYHDRIFSLHLKDKTGPRTTPPNENQVWGQGEVPLDEVLLLLKEHAGEKDWPVHADIELEYPVPSWSNSVKEVRTCLNYVRQILI